MADQMGVAQIQRKPREIRGRAAGVELHSRISCEMRMTEMSRKELHHKAKSIWLCDSL